MGEFVIKTKARSSVIVSRRNNSHILHAKMREFSNRAEGTKKISTLLSVVARATTILSVLFSTALSLVAIYISLSQTTATYDAVRLQEQDKLYDDYIKQAHDLCNSIAPNDVKANFHYNLTDGFGIAFRNDLIDRSHLEDLTKAEDENHASATNRFSSLNIPSRPQEFVAHPVFPAMMRLSNLLQYRTGFPTPDYLWGLYQSYSQSTRNINEFLQTVFNGEKIDPVDMADIYFRSQVSCYLSVTNSINQYYKNLPYSQPRVEFWLGGNQ